MRQARKDLQPSDVDAAMADAIRFLSYCQRHGLLPCHPQPKVSMFQPTHNPNELLGLYSNDLDALFKMAREGDAESDLVLRQSILEDVKKGPLARQKQEALGWLLLARPPESSAPRDPHELTDRNFLIATAVYRITALGFTPTRNRARTADSASACQITAMALKKLGMPMTERAIERVWNESKQVVEKRGFAVPLKW
jgi:hypothetical protein